MSNVRLILSLEQSNLSVPFQIIHSQYDLGLNSLRQDFTYAQDELSSHDKENLFVRQSLCSNKNDWLRKRGLLDQSMILNEVECIGLIKGILPQIGKQAALNQPLQNGPSFDSMSYYQPQNGNFTSSPVNIQEKKIIVAQEITYHPFKHKVIQYQPVQKITRRAKPRTVKKITKKQVKPVEKTVVDYVTVEHRYDYQVSYQKQQKSSFEVVPFTQTITVINPSPSMRVIQPNPTFNSNPRVRTHINYSKERDESFDSVQMIEVNILNYQLKKSLDYFFGQFRKGIWRLLDHGSQGFTIINQAGKVLQLRPNGSIGLTDYDQKNIRQKWHIVINQTSKIRSKGNLRVVLACQRDKLVSREQQNKLDQWWCLQIQS